MHDVWNKLEGCHKTLENDFLDFLNVNIQNFIIFSWSFLNFSNFYLIL